MLLGGGTGIIHTMLTPPAALEALLFAAGEPLSKKQAAAFLGITPEQLAMTVEGLGAALAERGLALIVTDTVLELRTTPDASELVQRLRENEFSRDLGKGSLETLAIIAYQDGATRSDIDWVRGVNSSASLRTLLLRGLIESHEDAADKRRLRYRLTPDALGALGLRQVTDLPRAEELRTATRTMLEAIDAPVEDAA